MMTFLLPESQTNMIFLCLNADQVELPPPSLSFFSCLATKNSLRMGIDQGGTREVRRNIGLQACHLSLSSHVAVRNHVT